MVRPLTLALICLALLGAAAPGPRPSPAEGPPLEFRDVPGRPHPPLAPPGQKATVLLFLLTDCPVSNAYAPEVARICAAYEPKKVSLFVVHADPDVTAEDARKHARDYSLPCPV